MEQTYMKKADLANVLKLLGDQTRLSVMSYLEEDECCVCEFVELLNMSQPAISQHLRKLRDAKLVKEKRKGNWIFYEINKGHEAYYVVHEILKQIPDSKKELDELSNNNLRIICD
ncbi:ArsR/SmtB family transcription factor [Halalkalibacillus halophilus]|uniref:ArsR/SmtB family transcription factor n=1 Tax=Halalkalibacillus halophilus TaxID=392827 RepID=UPI00040BDCD3|nr:metalloregulator ArsR/SmtB family transcription factor [Halalkalibacillus halophilus]